MRIRFKPWARGELEASSFYIDNPEEYKGKWRSLFENDKPIHLELGCGKGGFISQLASNNLDINYIAIDMVDAMLGLAKRNIESVYAEKNIPFFSLVKQKHSNMMIQIQFSGIAEEADKLRFADIPFMFTNYCRTYDEIKVFKEFGAEEVYVVEDLGFNIKKLQCFRKDGLKIRLIKH